MTVAAKEITHRGDEPVAAAGPLFPNGRSAQADLIAHTGAFQVTESSTNCATATIIIGGSPEPPRGHADEAGPLFPSGEHAEADLIAHRDLAMSTHAGCVSNLPGCVDSEPPAWSWAGPLFPTGEHSEADLIAHRDLAMSDNVHCVSKLPGCVDSEPPPESWAGPLFPTGEHSEADLIAHRDLATSTTNCASKLPGCVGSEPPPESWAGPLFPSGEHGEADLTMRPAIGGCTWLATETRNLGHLLRSASAHG